MADALSIHGLYRRVARIPGGLARLEDEVTEAWVNGFLTSALDRGLSFIAEADGRLLGEIHAYSPPIFCFAHVLGELTIAVDPDAQGQGLGRLLFSQLMATVEQTRPDIQRVELIARESNEKAIRFYESLGFEREGLMRARIRNLDGSLEADVPMAWIRTDGKTSGGRPG